MNTSLAHKIGNARMVRALAEYDRTHPRPAPKERTTPMTAYIRIRGHAGVWEIDGPALVLTDDDCFEHPTMLVAHQVADPGRFAVIEPGDTIPFTVEAVVGPTPEASDARLSLVREDVA